MTSLPLRALIEAELEELEAIRRDLHANPELGYAEHRTASVVRRELEALGIEVTAGIAGGTGVLGALPGASSSTIGLRADMDALPIAERTDLPYRSTSEGVMHACGHDGHTTILIGAARVLARLAGEGALPNPVRFLFQPAEEGGAGAARMIEDGALGPLPGNPAVGQIYGLHGWPTDPLGLVRTRSGPMLAAADKFSVRVRGEGVHAAFPHQGVDVVVAGAALVGAFQQIASRDVSALDAVVLSVSQFHAGTAFNILPDEATLTGTVRTFRDETRRFVIARMEAICAGLGAAHRCEIELDYTVGYPVTANDAAAAEMVARHAAHATRFAHMEEPAMVGEDFSYYGAKVPACFFTLGLLPDGVTSMPKLHQPDFDFNDDAIAVGVELFCRLALEGALG